MVNRNDAAVVATAVNGEVVLPQRRVPRGLRHDREVRPVPARRRHAAARAPCTPDMARTQQQRREETVARLLDASIATIIDVGYARASAAVITRRAGLSGGALFRHFDTMGDFMAATAYEVMRRQLDCVQQAGRRDTRQTGPRSRRCCTSCATSPATPPTS